MITEYMVYYGKEHKLYLHN